MGFQCISMLRATTVHLCVEPHYVPCVHTMMRVEIDIDDSVRGLVAKYADETDQSMPQAYKELILYGLEISDVEFPTFSPDVDLPDDIQKISNMSEDDYDIIVE